MYLGVYDPYDVATADLYSAGCAQHHNPACLCDVDRNVKAPPARVAVTVDGEALKWVERRLQAAEHPPTDREQLEELLLELESDQIKLEAVRMIVNGAKNKEIQQRTGHSKDELTQLRKTVGIPGKTGPTVSNPNYPHVAAWINWAKQQGHTTQWATKQALGRWEDLTKRDVVRIHKMVRQTLEI